MMIDFDDGQPDSLSFILRVGDQPISFKLPSNWRGVLAAMRREKATNRLLNPQQARRVAWRILRDWLKAQLSLIEAGASSIEEVMLPWAITNDGTTVAKRLLTGKGVFLGLPAPKVGDR